MPSKTGINYTNQLDIKLLCTKALQIALAMLVFIAAPGYSWI